MKQIIEGARKDFGHLPLNAGMIAWLEDRTGRTGSLQDLMAAYAAQQGVRSVNELPPVQAPGMYAIIHRNEQAFHVGRPGRPSLKRMPRRRHERD